METRVDYPLDVKLKTIKSPPLAHQYFGQLVLCLILLATDEFATKQPASDREHLWIYK